MERVTLGILGGVFDPPHNGHVALARAAIAQLGLDRLLVLVVADPGHRGVETPAETRLELARLAFADVAGANVELDPHPRTVDSLEARALDDPVFVIGADELVDFQRWKRPERVLELVRLGVARRPGVSDSTLASALASLPASDRVVFFELEPTAVSSTDVRARLAHGEPIEDLVPERVAQEIARLGLYRDSE
ncbi:MAG: nicotinate-nucleotide adenylyltransferase [Gaiellaceae bacterium]